MTGPVPVEVPGGDLDPEHVRRLYDAVGWSSYTRDLTSLLRGLRDSHLVLVCRDVDGGLAGLVRTLSDGSTACYVQDLLVHPSARRTGVGRALLGEVLRRYARCRFVGLSTDAAGTAEAEASHPFYRSLGLVPHAERGMAAFVRADPPLS